MILVKSLIALLLILIGLYLYEKLHLLGYFDGREGFETENKAGASGAGASGAGASGAGASGAGTKKDDSYNSESILKASKKMADETIELKFSEKMPLEQHKEMANDADIISNLQAKMNDLLKLKDEATDINNNLKIKK
jgi:hypothetical protein